MRARKPKLLVVDDGERYVELAHALLRDYDYATRCDRPGPCWECPERPGCTRTHAHDAAELDEALERHPDVDAVLLDVVFELPEDRLIRREGETLARSRRLQGLSILERLRRVRGELPVILATSSEELALAGSEALAADELVSLAGADAFDARALALSIEALLARRRERPESGGYAFGASKPMQQLRTRCLALAPTSLPMLVLGETGTGKTALVERVLHPATGSRGPFVSVDLSAIPSTLVAAELFGTARGAYSGAVDRAGLFAEADGGTLLLDEIGNLEPELQRMLLVVLETGRVRRLGETRERNVRLKLIAATNVDLSEAVARGRFRADLYARLNPASRLVLPPLRERLEDLETLVAGFVARTFATGPDRLLLATYLAEAGLPGPPDATVAIGAPTLPRSGVAFALSRSSWLRMRRHAWPGNVRELALFVANATLVSLSEALGALSSGRESGRSSPSILPIPDRLVATLLDGPSASPSPVLAGAPDAPQRSLHEVARTLEREHYRRLFERTSGDFDAMARALLEGDPTANARRVRLRFNQLGLRARARPRRGGGDDQG